MKTIHAFVEDPSVIRTMTDSKIRLLAEKLKSRVNRSPSAYNRYVREQMRWLKERENAGEIAKAPSSAKFSQIAEQWTNRDNPYKCGKSVKAALQSKLCPRCPDDQGDEWWSRVEWSSPSRATSPVPSRATSPVPSRATSPVPSRATSPVPSRATSPVPSVAARRCPEQAPVYCHDGANRNWCVQKSGDCQVVKELLNYSRKKPLR